jgi:cytochrome c oxidase assembly protein subunit 15
MSNSRAFRAYAWSVLAYNVAVVLWGAFVRATGSGAGCGNHWPLCNGEVTPHSPAVATVIEFTHRVTSGLDLALVALLVVWAFRAFPRGHAVRRWAALSGAFLISEALIGAALVLWQQVAQNASMTRAWALSGHLLNTLALLGCLTMTAHVGQGTAPFRLNPRGRAAWMAFASLAAFAFLGVSGAIAALGDTLFPARSLAAGLAQDMNPAAALFVRLRIFHPLIAAGTGAWLLYFAVSSAGRRRDARGRAWTVAGLVFFQFLLGVVNIALLAPVWMQLVHLLGADLLWISLVLLSASLLSAERKAVPAPAPAAAP